MEWLNLLHPAVKQLIKQAGKIAAIKRTPIYFVGGIVRDLMLGNPPTDIDIVAQGDAIALANELCRQFGGQVYPHHRFGAAKWRLTADAWDKLAPGYARNDAPDEIDFMTARAESYPQPTELPNVQPSHINDDLNRRDFTINALAIRLDNSQQMEILDLHGGIADLKDKVVRVLHDGSFIDDPTRILRAYRFAQRLDFEVESHTSQLIHDALPLLGRVSGKRIQNEMVASLKEPHPADQIRRLNDNFVLIHIHPELRWHEGMSPAFDYAAELCRQPMWQAALNEDDQMVINFLLWMYPHPLYAQKAVASRLRVRKNTQDDIIATRNLLATLSSTSAQQPSEIAQIIKNISSRPRALVTSSAIAAANRHRRIVDWIDAFQAEWRHLRPALNGNDLLEMGAPAGEKIGDALAALLSARIDGLVANGKEEREFVRQWLKDNHPQITPPSAEGEG